MMLDYLKTAKKPVIHICSGSFNIGDIRIDRYKINCFFRDGHDRWKDDYLGNPNVLGDMCRLPIKSGIAGTVICDPPYEFEYQKDGNLIDELSRILKPRGLLIFYAPWVPINTVLKCNKIEPHKIGSERKYFKLLSEFVKINGMIEDYV